MKANRRKTSSHFFWISPVGGASGSATGRRREIRLVAVVAAVVVIGTFGGLTASNVSAQAAVSWMPTTPTNWPLVVTDTATPKTTLTAGVTEHSEVLDTVSGRQSVRLMNVDTNSRNIRLGVVGAGDTLINPADETTSSMATRTGAVAGINGGFFDVNASGQPLDGEIVDGTIWKSPRRNHNGTFVVLKDGSNAIRDEEFSGTITDGAVTHDLFSINRTGDASANQITEITPHLGGPTDLSTTSPVFVQGTSKDGGVTLTVTSVAPITSLPALPKDTAGLLASAAGGAWLVANIHLGDTVSVSHMISPDNNIQQLIQGPGHQLLQDGKITPDFADGNPSGNNPETVIGVGSDGRQVLMATLDGRQSESTAFGPTVAQVAGYMQQQGVDSALLLDGGGSTTMVGRKPGASTVAVLNSPSDSGGLDRAVGNSILVYSTEVKPGPAATATINDGGPVNAVVGVPATVPAYATDLNGNAARGDGVTVTVQPVGLGTWANGVFTPAGAGTGTLTVAQGRARASVPLTVAPTLSTLTSTPAQTDLDNGTSTTLTLTGTTASGSSIPVPSASARWTLSDSGLGSIDPATGIFTASANTSGIETVTARAANAVTSITIGVGSTPAELDPMNDSTAWSYNITNGAVATATTDAAVPPGSTHNTSIRLDYSMPGTRGVHQMALFPKTTITIDKNAAGQIPTALAVWIKDDDTVHNAFEFVTSYTQSNGQSVTLYDTAIAYNSWSLHKTSLPPGTAFPLTFNFFDMLSINPTQASTGTLRLSSLQTLYAARTPQQPAYTAIPESPSWLQYVESPSDFTGAGRTVLMGDDAHLLANDPGSVSSHVLADIAARTNGTGYNGATGQKAAALPKAARPQLAQLLGDMADNGQSANLAYAAQKISALNVPYHDLVGNHEISQGADPETGDFNQTFGRTHYSYTLGAATVIALDNSHGGVTSSDATQVPDEKQYPWMVNELDAANTPVVVIAVHMPAHDPFPAKNSQFSDRYEAQEYLQIVQNYRATHPGVHVLMVNGHARGFADQILTPQGQQVSGNAGIPQLTFADLGMPAYTTPDQGGFYHFGLVHITNSGTVQFAVEPVLESLTINGPTAPTVSTTLMVTARDASAAASKSHQKLQVGNSETLTATGVNQTGNNLDPVSVPIADPVSHVWTSSNSSIVSIDAVTGKIVALKPGTSTITVTAGGLTAKLKITVSPSKVD